MRTIAILAVLLILTVPAAAEERAISLDRRDCAGLVRHALSSDVTYKPGVDARGGKVAPADLGGGNPIDLPERFEIPISIDLGDRLGIPLGGSANYLARFPVGTVTVARDGRVAFNGVPLTDDETAELAARCQQTGAGR